ncbi:MAG: HTTM domain-containing protein [Bacteroidetes bacterium SW_11_45_7]|nr:MAG: HTTM domain-containing protein [Bacteroidetes bacterium SW_11_45_7]
MLASAIRFVANGWVKQLYVMPHFHFKYYGFEWVTAFDAVFMYALFALMGISALGIMLGLAYRWSALIFFLAFTYIELIDKTYYLNHYYFISIVSFLMIFLPAHRYFSLDVLRKPAIKITHIPRWITGVLQLQLALVYFFAGAAKLNYDWLFRAQPLQIWLPANSDLPLIGRLFDYAWVAYFLSWFGAFYDLTIPFWLSWRKTRWLAYAAVIAFHGMTAVLFQIGMFPYIMILATLIFFSPGFHQQIVEWLRYTGRMLLGLKPRVVQDLARVKYSLQGWPKKAIGTILIAHFAIQLLVPLRHVLYSGDLFWNEQGFRFSWRVMLIEKAGTAFFYVEDPSTGGEAQVDPGDHLTKFQEKEMAAHPDMVLQFAHFLKNKYKEKGIENPRVRVKDYVSLNGRGSQLMINPEVDLASREQGFHQKDWLLPLDDSPKHLASVDQDS